MPVLQLRSVFLSRLPLRHQKIAPERREKLKNKYVHISAYIGKQAE